MLVDLDVIVEPTRHFFHAVNAYSLAGSDLSAGRSISSNKERRLVPRWRVSDY